MTRRAILASILLSSAIAVAQPATPDDMSGFEKDLDALFQRGGLTADGAAQRAGKASPTVRRKIAEVEASIAVAEQVELARVPVVQAKASYTRLSPVDPLNLGAVILQIPENSYDIQASVVVPLSDYVLRYPKLIHAARQGENVARSGQRAAAVDAGQEARLAYYEWVRLRLQVLIARRQLAQVKFTLDRVRVLAENQRLSKVELYRVESQEAQAEQVVDQLLNLENLREEQLRLLIGATAEEPLSIGEDIRGEVTAAPEGKLDDLLGHATQRRLDVATLDLGIAAKDEQRVAEESAAYPRLSAFGNVDEARPNQRIFPLQDAFNITWSVGLQVTWQLSDALVSDTNQKRIRAETAELRADRENLLRGARIQLLAAQQAVQLAQRALATTQKGLVAAEEGYRVRRELLAAERATAVELVDAQTDLTRARIAALDARVDLRVALAELAHALGDDVTR